MISLEHFLKLVAETTGRDVRGHENASQFDAIVHDGEEILHIAAGPGSGKTSVLVLVALKQVFVNGVQPEQVLITTFTRRAAKELRTRWLDWGSSILSALPAGVDSTRIDLNRCRIDTLDAVAQQLLTEFRLPGALAPVVAEGAASQLLFKRFVFREPYRTHRATFDTFLARYTFDGKPPRNQGEALAVTKRLVDRLVQDCVDIEQYKESGVSQALLSDMLTRTREMSAELNMYDFALLEERFLLALEGGELGNWCNQLGVVLVDEYQDTNPLQEAIYFALIRHTQAFAAVVGDDDQAMYRFRGGSVELFSQFGARCEAATGRPTMRINMVRNFRSRPEIVEFYNQHASEGGFQAARLLPRKPPVEPNRQSGGVRVLGLFRPDESTLARDLAQLLTNMLESRRLQTAHGTVELQDANDLGDIVLLGHTVEETRFNPYQNSVDYLFPSLLRSELRSRDRAIFNPRGNALRTVPNVGVLLGLLLSAIDPDGFRTEEATPTNEARYYIQRWREVAARFIEDNPAPNENGGIAQFISDWRSVSDGSAKKGFPRDWSALELLYKLITWIPHFQEDAEHQVWLEAISRLISSAGVGSPYGMQLLQSTRKESIHNHVRQSRASLIRDALVPLAENEVEVDEDIIASVPRGVLQVMTIHQAKGLEFPMVIVDVGSRFKSNHAGHRFRRFPVEISNTVREEEDVEQFLSSPLRSNRPGIDRVFDDLVRLYYVAYSRPQSVLLLIGSEACLRYGKGRDFSGGAVPNMALGWCRDGSWPWRQPFEGKKAPVFVNPPFEQL